MIYTHVLEVTRQVVSPFDCLVDDWIVLVGVTCPHLNDQFGPNCGHPTSHDLRPQLVPSSLLCMGVRLDTRYHAHMTCPKCNPTNSDRNKFGRTAIIVVIALIIIYASFASI